MDGREGGWEETNWKTDRQIKKDVCQKEIEGKNAREKSCKENSEIPYTMYKNVYFDIYMHNAIKQRYLLYSIVFRTYPLHCYKEKYPFCSNSKVFDFWTSVSAEFHLFLKTQLSRVFETSHDHIIFLGAYKYACRDGRLSVCLSACLPACL